MKTLILILLSIISCQLVGQTLNFSDLNGEKPRGTFETYISKIGDTLSIGDTLKIGAPSGANGNFIYIQKLDFTGTFLVVGPEATNSNAQIKNIRVSGTKRSGWKANIQTKGFTSLDNYYINIEDAIASGEIKSQTMTSDEALIELKKAKDKLDLELITQDEYDKIKKELSKYIK